MSAMILTDSRGVSFSNTIATDASAVSGSRHAQMAGATYTSAVGGTTHAVVACAASASTAAGSHVCASEARVGAAAGHNAAVACK